ANVLLSAGAWGSFVVGALSVVDPRWPNFLPVAAWLMALHLFFGYFKLDTRKKASEAVRRLLSLQPPRARVVRGDEAVEVLTSEVAVGETLVVRPGERIPLDGEVVAGAASVDEASFTGESVPAAKELGATVIGGTLDLDGELRVRVTKVGEETFLSQIVRLMTNIAERKPPLELLADRLMNYYGPVVFVVAGVAFVGWLAVTGDPMRAALVLLTTIIMGYPCALGITTPMLAAIAGGKGISVGLLVKASEVFYGLSITDTVVFDKTGTLTYGRPTVTDLVAFGTSRDDVLSFAAAVEASSEHPLGQAIAFFAQREGVAKLAAADFRAHPGKGVTATVSGVEVTAGKPRFVEERGVRLSDEVRGRIARLSAEGKTVVVIARGGDAIGVVALQDTPRRGARRLIEKLRARGINTVMLTGDARPVGEAVGRLLGVDEVQAELLPPQKVAAIEVMQRDVGRASYRTLTGNVVVAVLFNIVGMFLAALGLVTPLFAIGFMVVSIFGILLNTLRVRAIGFEREDATEIERLAELELLVPNMVCEGCAEKIATALRSVPGVREVRSKVPQKHVYVRYEPTKVGEEQLKDAVGQAGFTALAA
ncbi:MAG: heavy metal translocating P-type ATPase, partial [Deltaproteobacteria bacterium]